jgi:hypothetical protein
MDLQEQISLLVSTFSSGPGFPVDSPGGTGIQLYRMGRGFVFLNDTNLYFYNHSGKQLSTMQIDYNAPVVKTTSSYAMLYDINDKGLTVYNKAGKVFDQQYDLPIYAADLINNRTLAVATQSRHYASELTVYTDFTESFKWYSAENMVTALCLDPEGKTLAVGGVTASQGVLCSSLYFFSISTQQQISKTDLQDEYIYHISYKHDGVVHVITDKRAIAFDQDGNILGQYNYEDANLSYFSSQSANGSVLLFDRYGTYQSYTLVSLDEYMEKPSQQQIPYAVDSVFDDDNTIYLVGSQTINTYDRSCNRSPILRWTAFRRQRRRAARFMPYRARKLSEPSDASC